MKKKERVLAAITGKEVDYIPSGFWLHFPKEQCFGQAAIDAHIDFYKKTDVDILKVMNENLYPVTYKIEKASDWNHIKPIKVKESFVQSQIAVIKGVVDAAGGEPVILATMHGVVVSAKHCSGMKQEFRDWIGVLSKHLRENPKAVEEAFKIISEGLIEMGQAFLEAGADGIYYAALGAEKDKLTDEEFEKYIKPYDISVLESIQNMSMFNTLHMCKNGLNLSRFKDYPAKIVNWASYENNLSLEEGRKLFKNATILGGYDDRSGTLVTGSMDEIEAETHSLIKRMGTKKFILGSDCTLPTDIKYEKIGKAISSAKTYYIAEDKR